MRELAAFREGARPIPFTPFHFGPGLFVKACVPRRFWLTPFLAANLLIDVEVLYYLWRGSGPLHRYTHTYLAATVIGILAGIASVTAIRWVRRIRPSRSASSDFMRSMTTRSELICSVVSGILGGVSHVFLDSLMHRDMHPFWPFQQGNALVGLVDVGMLHIGCAVTGFFGLIFWVLLKEP